jgi:hypothetical protein
MLPLIRPHLIQMRDKFKKKRKEEESRHRSQERNIENRMKQTNTNRSCFVKQAVER